eukprot:395258-Hanusia_phi.AAC.1
MATKDSVAALEKDMTTKNFVNEFRLDFDVTKYSLTTSFNTMKSEHEKLVLRMNEAEVFHTWVKTNIDTLYKKVDGLQTMHTTMSHRQEQFGDAQRKLEQSHNSLNRRIEQELEGLKNRVGIYTTDTNKLQLQFKDLQKAQNEAFEGADNIITDMKDKQEKFEKRLNSHENRLKFHADVTAFVNQGTETSSSSNVAAAFTGDVEEEASPSSMQDEAAVGISEQGEAAAGISEQGEAPVGISTQNEAAVGINEQGEAAVGISEQGEAPVGISTQNEAAVSISEQGEAAVGI